MPTKTALKKLLKSQGKKMPHGYDITRRKKTVRKKSTRKKTRR